MTVALCRHKMPIGDCADCKDRLDAIKSAAERRAGTNGTAPTAAPMNRLEGAAVLREIVKTLGPGASNSEIIAAAATRGLKPKGTAIWRARVLLGFPKLTNQGPRKSTGGGKAKTSEPEPRKPGRALVVVKPKAIRTSSVAPDASPVDSAMVPLAAVADLLRSVVPLGGPAVARQILEALE